MNNIKRHISLLLSSLLIIIFVGCNDVNEQQRSMYKDYPKVCKDYFQTYDGEMMRGKSAIGVRAVMKYCKFREEKGN